MDTYTLSEDDGMIWVEPGSNVILKIKEAENSSFHSNSLHYREKKPNVSTVLPGKAICMQRDKAELNIKLHQIKKRCHMMTRLCKLSGFVI